jgi:hypothetical protein
MTPFRNVALMRPATTKADAGTHTSVFGAAADGLIGWRVSESGIREAAGFQPLGRAAGGRPGQPRVLHHVGNFVVDQTVCKSLQDGPT